MAQYTRVAGWREDCGSRDSGPSSSPAPASANADTPRARAVPVRVIAASVATGDAQIVEHTANDRSWGDGGDGSGKNRLGQILVRVREELRKV